MIVLLLCIGIFIYIRYPKEKYTYAILKQNNGINLDSIEWMGVAPDGVSTCLVEYGATPSIYDVVPGKYIVHEDVEEYTRAVFYDEECLGFEDYHEVFELYLCDIKTKERTHIYDIKELVEQNYPGCYISSYGGVYEWEGQNVYEVCITEKEWEEDYPWEELCLYISIQDKSYAIYEKEIEKWSIHTTDIFYRLNEERLLLNNLSFEMLEEMGHPYIYALPYQNFEGVFCIDGLAEYLPEHNEVLYGMFPGLEQYRGEENCYICLYIGGNPTAEELLRLFMEDGQEISFEGAVLPGEYSIDGEDHEIHSFEEYEQWYDEGESTKE